MPEGHGIVRGIAIPMRPILEFWRVSYGITEAGTPATTREKIRDDGSRLGGHQSYVA